MRTVESMLMQEKKKLEGMVKRAKKRMETAPKGHLRVRKGADIVEYYYRAEGERWNCNGRYMKKSERELVSRIAQRDYDIRMIKCAEERINAIKRFVEKYKHTKIEMLYEKTNPNRRALLHDVELSDDEFIKAWQSVKYEGKFFADETKEIITERGERVRSKSEKIIADKLYSLAIPYRYEYPLVLDGNIKVYPDFTILKMPEREEVYLEHFGMMDDEEYVEKVLFKLSSYERNEIFLGVNLFITCETAKRTLNTRALDKMLRKIFCEE